MRNYISLAILCLIFSCKSNTKQSYKDSSSIAANTENSDLLIKKFTPLLQGTWVNKIYIDKVAKTKSPLAAVNEAEGMSSFSINTSEMKGDSIIVPVGWDNHDGSNLTLSFKSGKRPSSLIFGAGELSVAVNHGDTIVNVYYPYDKGQVKATQFIRANSKKTMQVAEGMCRLINKALIAGSYNLQNTKANSVVMFGIDGKVKGFENFKNYVINIDLNSDVMDNLDEIRFDDDARHHKSYSFKFDADTLKLYDTQPNADSSLLILDKLRYKLVRNR
ncbi:hypothetical protein J3L18_15525 [Mucilaginibacter gossypii]|uniref:hypothetical protein n=1 Tax=Mucilaginibacter gossypii TaxID=551996 RepID=UPI000DCF50E3|nr:MULTISPECIES: hypothetical protein [Mucilaginibacter]QTE34569.1 hypothetical protein J3L18_15525 [Mucilaginibacter gossypii]RAV57675.1 hypothetical protein DIU36_11820 [Mucilaginibacter rubeus]